MSAAYQDKPTFEQKLFRALAPTFALGLFLVWMVSLEIAYIAFKREALQPLDQEADVIKHAVLRNGKTLHPEFYLWDEPHHLYTTPRIDPFFVVLLDTTGKTVRVSDNVRHIHLPLERIYPTLAKPYGYLTLADRTLIFGTYPLVNQAGKTVGTLWIARYDPGWKQKFFFIAFLLGLGLLLLFFLLMWLTRRTARHVLIPLQHITEAASTLNPYSLQKRVTIPEDADRETALLAHTLNEQLDHLQETLERLRTFSFHAAHELQTPLTVFIGHLEFLLRRPRPWEQQQKHLHILLEEARAMQRMIHQLLLLARLEGDTQAIHPQSVSLSDLAYRATQQFKPGVESKGLKLYTYIQPAITLCGYEHLLQEVLVNLLDNALKYTSEGSILLQLHQEQTGDIYLIVEDTGKGIEAGDLERVTLTFYRAKEHPEIPGYGLGLTLVERIVRFHQGNMTIESTPGKGTRITIAFPAKQGEKEPCPDESNEA